MFHTSPPLRRLPSFYWLADEAKTAACKFSVLFGDEWIEESVHIKASCELSAYICLNFGKRTPLKVFQIAASSCYLYYTNEY